MRLGELASKEGYVKTTAVGFEVKERRVSLCRALEIEKARLDIFESGG